MNSSSFVLDCQPIRSITAGYECVIIVSLQARAKLSPCVLWGLPNCCPITQRHLPDQNCACWAELICEMLKITLSCLRAVMLRLSNALLVWLGTLRSCVFVANSRERNDSNVFWRNAHTHPAPLFPSYVRPATLNFLLSCLCGLPFMLATESRSLTTGLNLISVLIWSNLLGYDRNRAGRSGCARKETL